MPETAPFISFNSKLVRLKVFFDIDDFGVECTSFNSKLVRLKGLDSNGYLCSCSVSIPNWFD